MKCLEISVISLLVFVIQCRTMSHDELEDFSNFLVRTSQLDQNVKKRFLFSHIISIFLDGISVAHNVEPQDELDDEPISDHAWEESGKFEGDLILNEKQRHLIVENVAEGLSRNGLKDSTKRWPNNEVIYFIQKEHFSGDQVQAIENGIDEIVRASCIKFRPYKKGDRDAVVIQGSRRGCFSQVGYQGGYQVLNLAGRHPVGRGCFRHGTVVHELLHTLGFYHMQSSHDRDDYVDIVWKNIREQAKNNFRKYNSFSVSDFGIGYDYDSVLHYSRRAFSVNGRDTIIPKQAGADIGQRVGLSEKDTQKLNKMYCEADSSHFDDNEDENKKPSSSKKKKPKNTPFEGHGIGYHQGKAVAIRLPAAITYKLPVIPSYQVFDFSKAPKTVSSAVIQDLGIGKEVEHHETPSSSTLLNDKSVVPVPDLRKVVIDDNLSKINEHKDTNSLNGAIENTKHNNSTQFKKHDTRSYLNDDFDRLSKVIKNKVYPSQTTDLKEYKVFNEYGKYFNPNEKTVYQSSLKDDETPDEHENINYKDYLNFYGSVQKDQAKHINNEDYPSRKWSANKYPFYTLKSSEIINDINTNDKFFYSPSDDSMENNQYTHDFSRLYDPKIYKINTKTHSLFGDATPVQDNWYQREFKDKCHHNRESGEHQHKQQNIDQKTNERGLESYTIENDGVQENNFRVAKELHDDFLKKIKRNYLHTQSVDFKRKNIGSSTETTVPYVLERSKAKQVAFDDYLLDKMNLQNRIASILKGYHKYDNFDAPSFNFQEI